MYFILILGTSCKKLMFPIELWNAYDRTTMNLPRSKQFHRRMAQRVCKNVAIAHPSVTKLAEKIRCQKFRFEVNAAQIRQGQEPKPKKVQYRKLDESIKRLVDDYSNVELGEYLNGLAANVFVIFLVFCVLFLFIIICHLFLLYEIDSFFNKSLFQSFSIK